MVEHQGTTNGRSVARTLVALYVLEAALLVLVFGLYKAPSYEVVWFS